MFNNLFNQIYSKISESVALSCKNQGKAKSHLSCSYWCKILKNLITNQLNSFGHSTVKL
jgi:hypothetical protein